MEARGSLYLSVLCTRVQDRTGLGRTGEDGLCLSREWLDTEWDGMEWHGMITGVYDHD